MKTKTLLLTLTALFAAVASSSASSITFSAAIANNLAGVSEAPLASGVLIEVGTYTSGSFTLIGSGSNDNVTFGPGFFANPLGKLDTSALAGSQLAYRWTEATDNNTGIIYYDIATGADSNRVSQWTLAGGNGGGTDFNTNAIDVTDLTVDIAGFTLDAAAVLINVEFSGNNSDNKPSFNVIAIPEPSTFAALAGLCALGAVMVRRRRA